MNEKLKEINEIISLSEQLIEYIKKFGEVKYYLGTRENNIYRSYKIKIDNFVKKYQLNQNKDYAIFSVLKLLYLNTSTYAISLSEAEMIKDTLIKLKKDILPHTYEQIFISHSEKDAQAVNKFIDLLHAIGFPKSFETSVKSIFCTSHPDYRVPISHSFTDEIKQQLHSHRNTLYIFWYSDNFFASQACLNEVGAIWALDKKYYEITMPDFDSSKIKGFLSKTNIRFAANDKLRLNDFKEQIEQMFELPSLHFSAWEDVRDNFIYAITTN